MDLTTDEQLTREYFESQMTDPSYKFKRSRKGHYINPVLEKNWKCFRMGVTYGEELRTSAGGTGVQPGPSERAPGAIDQHDPNGSGT